MHPECPHGRSDDAPSARAVEGASVNASSQLALLGDKTLKGYALTATLTDLGADFVYVECPHHCMVLHGYICAMHANTRRQCLFFFGWGA